MYTWRGEESFCEKIKIYRETGLSLFDVNEHREISIDFANWTWMLRIFRYLRYPVINEKNMPDCIILFSLVFPIYMEKNNFSMTIREKEEEEKDKVSIDRNFNRGMMN